MSLKLKGVVNESSSEYEEDDKLAQDTGIDSGLPSLEKLNLNEPKKKLLILDLGGLLVDRVYRHDRTSAQLPRRPDGIVVGNFLVFKRPFCTEFMKFCLERFEVGIWSSARERNVDAVLSTIMRGLKNKLLFIWDQNECIDSGFKSLEKKDKPIFLKDLSKVWRNPTFAQYSSSNTLLIDDDPYKAMMNPANTAIFPSKYKAEKKNDTALAPKGELQKFLEGLADAEDVGCYVKEHPIGQPAITETHSDWDYYSKIKRHFG